MRSISERRVRRGLAITLVPAMALASGCAGLGELCCRVDEAEVERCRGVLRKAPPGSDGASALESLNREYGEYASGGSCEKFNFVYERHIATNCPRQGGTP